MEETGKIKLTLHLGSGENVNSLVLNDFERIDSVQREIVPCLTTNGEISGVFLEINGHTVAKGYTNVSSWLDIHHRVRVARRHSRQLYQN